MKKIKNLPVFRMLAFVVALAILFGVFSVVLSFTVSADNVTSDNLPSSITGTFGNYPAVKFTASNQTFDPSTVFTEFDNKSYFGVFVYEKNGKLTVYDDLFSYLYNGSMFFDFANVRIGSPDETMFYILKTDRFKDSTSEQSVYFNNYVMLSAEKSKFNYSDLESNIPLNVYPPRVVTFDGFTDLYLIYTTAPSILSVSECKAKIADMTADVNKMSMSQWKETSVISGGSENGRFICFGNYKEYTYDEHLADISSGSVYQRIDYLASEQSKFTAFMYDDISCFNWADSRVKQGYINMYSSTSIAFNYYNSADSVGAVKLRVSKTQMFPSMRESDNPFDVSHYFVMKPANKHFSRYVIIEDGSLRSVPAKSTSTFRVNMQGYCNMDWNSYYLLEIVDVQTDTVISSTMFVYTGKNSGKIDGSNIKNGSFVSVDYQYEDGNKVNNGSLTPDSDGTLPNLPNGIKDETYNPTPNYNLSNLDVSDIFSTLNQATASVGAFFQATLNIIPVAIMTLILGSLALLIVLRVLGR